MKIALVAMSGVRACDQELLALGLTLPGFVERSKVIASLPSLGLLTLAGMTGAGHDVRYYEIADITNAYRPLDIDLAAISSYSAQIQEAYDLAAFYKERNIKVVMGGPHVSALPEEARRYCDAVVIGEAECVWHEILRDAEIGELKPFYGSLQNSFDLKDAPVPAYGLLDISKYNRLTVQTSRGCPWRCEFCASSPFFVPKYKQKPVEKVLAEIDTIKRIWPRPFIEFADDNAHVNKTYWKTLLPRLAERRVKWFSETDLSVAEDEGLLELMRESGCAEVLIGFESPNASGLDGIEMKTNWKFKNVGEYKRAIRVVQQHGIRVNACFTIGLDGHTERIFDDTFDFVNELCPYDVQITFPTPFPEPQLLFPPTRKFLKRELS